MKGVVAIYEMTCYECGARIRVGDDICRSQLDRSRWVHLKCWQERKVKIYLAKKEVHA